MEFSWPALQPPRPFLDCGQRVPVAAEFGPAKVAAAECEMAVFTLEGSFLPKLMQATSFVKAE